MSESIPKLPYELIQEILESFGEDSMDSLRSCGSTCQTWHVIARPLLFRSIILDRNTAPQKLSNLIFHSPDIAPLIRNLRFRVVHENFALLNNLFTEATLSPTILSRLSEIEIVGASLVYTRISQAIPKFSGFLSVRVLRLHDCWFQSAEAAYTLLYGFPELREFFCTKMYVNRALSTSRLEISGHPTCFPPHLKTCYMESVRTAYSAVLSPITTLPIKNTISKYIFAISSQNAYEQIGGFLRSVANVVECLEFMKVKPMAVSIHSDKYIDLSVVPNLQRLRITLSFSSLIPSRSTSLRRIDLFAFSPHVAGHAIDSVVNRLLNSHLPCLEEICFYLTGLQLYSDHSEYSRKGVEVGMRKVVIDEQKKAWEKVRYTLIPNACAVLGEKRPLRFSVMLPSVNDRRARMLLESGLLL